MRPLLIASALLICGLRAVGQSQPQPRTHSKPHIQSFVSYCATDGSYSEIPDNPGIATLSQIEDLQLQTGFGPSDKDGASFRFVRDGKTVFTFAAKDLTSPWIWTTIDPGTERLALTYSDGGAIGGFHVRVFQMKDEKIIDVSNSTELAVADFRKRHYCQTRGNNVEALKWVDGDLILMTSVYPTGDCGLDLGHTEAYRVAVPSGKIKEHLTLQQLKRYPGLCLQNDDGK